MPEVKPEAQEPIVDKAAKARAAVGNAQRAVDALKAEVDGLIDELSQWDALSAKEAREFLKEPWCIVPKSKDEWRVVIPRFVGLQVGWLERTTDTYNVFLVNRYAMWLGQVPEKFREILKLPEPFESEVADGRLRTGAKLPESVKRHLGAQTGNNEWRVKLGQEFDLIAALIEAGSLPFKPRPVDPADLRTEEITLRGELAKLYDYQQDGWKEFLKHGAIGVYWPWGQGKSIFGGYVCANLRGPKLVVVPTTTLVEQWEERLAKWMDLGLRSGDSQIDVVTYSAWERVKDKVYTAAVFDECHRLPANTFSRLASVRAKYRVGLSATPYREDGRTNYIFALTGRPVGTDWVEFIRSGRITKPNVEVRIVKGWDHKKRIAEQEARDTKGGVLIFCDSLQPGAELAARLKCPHIHGETKNRIEAVRGSRVSVVSRVGDEGLSLPDLKKVIEIDFLGSSRRQESQRVGRLFHAKGGGVHLVLMTRDEFDRFEGRFMALEEKGFKVVVTEVR